MCGNMPKEVRAMVSYGPGNIKLEQFPYPEPISNNAMIAKMRIAMGYLTTLIVAQTLVTAGRTVMATV